MFTPTRLVVLGVLAVMGCAAPSAVAVDPGPKVGDEAKEFELTALGGKEQKLSELVKDGSLVLVVLRGYPGYQCPLCSRQAAGFLSKADEFKKAGVRVAFIYPGPSKQLQDKAGEFVKGKDYPDHFQILLDPDYSFTKNYGLRWDEKGETAYPSTFVIGKNRQVTFAKVSTTHGGRVDAAEALKAVAAK
jgi:thioredoxin-dependent peroxiredoxin